jgi:hypothetical protein
MFPQLPEQVVLSGKDVNDILNVSFIGYPLVKKHRTRLSPVNILNPQPISSTIPRTRETTRMSQTMIDIQDDPKPDITASTTIITEQPPSPPQPHRHRKKRPSNPKKLCLSPCSWTPLDPPEHVPELTGLSSEVRTNHLFHLCLFRTLCLQ